MNTITLLQDQELWQRIRDFSIDKQDAAFPFSKKLAKEENWTADFTQKAIEEYKKFVYLCCVLPNGASPSETVDKVWHMHLIYTQNYWEEFCPDILRRKLHHHPSDGGTLEKIKHQDWFSVTLKNYRKVFQQEPPSEIWNNQNEKPEIKRKNFWSKTVKLLSFVSLILLLSSCSDFGDIIGNIIFLAAVLLIFFFVVLMWSSGTSSNLNNDGLKSKEKDGGSDTSGGGGSSCGSSCGGGCGGGCGGCGGG